MSIINRFMEQPSEQHVLAAKRVMRYLQGTIDYGVFYKKRERSHSLWGLLIVIMLEM